MHVADMGSRGVYRILAGKPERDHLRDPGVDGKLIIRWIIRMWDVVAWIGLIWHRIGTGAVHWWCDNEPPGYIKCGEFLD